MPRNWSPPVSRRTPATPAGPRTRSRRRTVPGGAPRRSSTRSRRRRAGGRGVSRRVRSPVCVVEVGEDVVGGDGVEGVLRVGDVASVHDVEVELAVDVLQGLHRVEHHPLGGVGDGDVPALRDAVGVRRPEDALTGAQGEHVGRLGEVELVEQPRGGTGRRWRSGRVAPVGRRGSTRPRTGRRARRRPASRSWRERGATLP